VSDSVIRVCSPMRLTAARKCVLMCLAAEATDDGRCAPSLSDMAEWTCFSRSTVAEAMKHLEGEGLVVVAERLAGRGITWALQVDRISACVAAQRGVEKTRAGVPPAGTPEPPGGTPVEGDQSASRYTTSPPAGTPATGGCTASRYTSPAQVYRQPDRGVPPAGMGIPGAGTGVPPAGTPQEQNTPYISPNNLNKKEGKKGERTRAKRNGAEQDLSEFASLLDGVEPQHLADWLLVRHEKKAGRLTRTALEAVVREARKAGITTPVAIAFCAEAEWRGFRADWYAERTASRANTHTPQRGGGLFAHRDTDQRNYEEDFDGKAIT
jgi:hypothetical protein